MEVTVSQIKKVAQADCLTKLNLGDFEVYFAPIRGDGSVLGMKQMLKQGKTDPPQQMSPTFKRESARSGSQI